MNRLSLEKKCGVTMNPNVVMEDGPLRFSNEYLCAHKMVELLELSKDQKRNFMTICDIHEIVSRNNLDGMDLFLHLEGLLGRDKVYYGNELTELADEMFLEFSWQKTNHILRTCRISRYDAWRLVIDSIYCIQPLFFHYINEKEFLFNWQCQPKEWIRQY